MKEAIEQFRENMKRVRSVGGLHDVASNSVGSMVDTSDLLRAQFVLGVSALDQYMHQAIRIGILEIFDGKRTATDQYVRLRISISCFDHQQNPAAFREALEADIREQHGYLTLQRPAKIAEAVKLISGEALWKLVSNSMGQPSQDVQDHLTLIVDRRNKIAHESDLDPTYPNARWPISSADVEQALAFLGSFVESVHLVVQ